MQGRTAALQRKLKDLAELVYVDAPHVVEALPAAADAGTAGAAAQLAVNRRAWLFAKQQADSSLKPSTGDALWQQQTEGWPASEAALVDVLRREGPFDGVLGFSQGAAVAAALCAQQQLQQQQQPLTCANAVAPLRFAILCSGFPSAAAEHKTVHAGVGSLQLPTLHMFGAHTAHDTTAAGHDHPGPHPVSHVGPPYNDRQVGTAASRLLLDMCEPRLCHVVEHSNAHIIPVDKRSIQQFRSFLLHMAVADATCT